MQNSAIDAVNSVNTAPVATEHQEQKCVIEWWALASSSFKVWEKLLFAIPNAGERHPAVGAKMKAEGLRVGCPDLCLAVARGGFHGLYCEMKRRGEKPRPSQVEFIEHLREQGYKAIACQGADDAMGAITAYLKLGMN